MLSFNIYIKYNTYYNNTNAKRSELRSIRTFLFRVAIPNHVPLTKLVIFITRYPPLLGQYCRLVDRLIIIISVPLRRFPLLNNMYVPQQYSGVILYSCRRRHCTVKTSFVSVGAPQRYSNILHLGIEPATKAWYIIFFSAHLYLPPLRRGTLNRRKSW